MHSFFHIINFSPRKMTLKWLKDGLAISEQGTNAELLFITIVAYNKKTE